MLNRQICIRKYPDAWVPMVLRMQLYDMKLNKLNDPYNVTSDQFWFFFYPPNQIVITPGHLVLFPTLIPKNGTKNTSCKLPHNTFEQKMDQRHKFNKNGHHCEDNDIQPSRFEGHILQLWVKVIWSMNITYSCLQGSWSNGTNSD